MLYQPSGVVQCDLSGSCIPPGKENIGEIISTKYEILNTVKAIISKMPNRGLGIRIWDLELSI